MEIHGLCLLNAKIKGVHHHQAVEILSFVYIQSNYNNLTRSLSEPQSSKEKGIHVEEVIHVPGMEWIHNLTEQVFTNTWHLSQRNTIKLTLLNTHKKLITKKSPPYYNLKKSSLVNIKTSHFEYQSHNSEKS